MSQRRGTTNPSAGGEGVHLSDNHIALIHTHTCTYTHALGQTGLIGLYFSQVFFKYLLVCHLSFVHMLFVNVVLVF